MSYKSVGFFIFLFSILILIFFNYDYIVSIIPITKYINFIVVIIGICGIFFPHLISKLKKGDDFEEIKEFLIEKYRKK